MECFQGQEHLDVYIGCKLARLLYKSFKFAKDEMHNLFDVLDGSLVCLLVEMLID